EAKGGERAGVRGKGNGRGGVQRNVGKNGGVNRVLECTKRSCGRGRAGRRIGGPSVEVSSVAVLAQLAEKKRLGTIQVEQKLEGANRRTPDGGKEIGLRVGGQVMREDAERVARIVPADQRVPTGRESRVGFGLDPSGFELRSQFSGCVVRETDVGGEEVLVEDRSGEEAAHLLFFDGIARRGQ